MLMKAKPILVLPFLFFIFQKRTKKTLYSYNIDYQSIKYFHCFFFLKFRKKTKKILQIKKVVIY